MAGCGAVAQGRGGAVGSGACRGACRLHEEVRIARGGGERDAEAGGIGGQGEPVVAPLGGVQVGLLRLSRHQPRDGSTALRREQREARVGVAVHADVQRARGGGGGGLCAGAEGLVGALYAQAVGAQGGRAEGAVLRGGRLLRVGAGG